MEKNDNKIIKIIGPIKGYKSFNLDKTNCYGKRFVDGFKYHCNGDIKFGPHGNGFHFAKNLEDTIRYSGNPGNGAVRDVLIASVIASGEIVEGFDDYNGYYEMFSCSDIKIVKFLTRNEILEYALSLPELRMARFVSLFRLNSTEIDLFRNKSYMVDNVIKYYQNENTNIEKVLNKKASFCDIEKK